VNFCWGRKLVVRDREGREIWRKTIADERASVEPGYFHRSPDLPYFVIWKSRPVEGKGDLIALSAVDGSELWVQKDTPILALKAISDNGKRQVFFKNGRIEVRSLPGHHAVTVDGVGADCDAAFADEKGKVLCLFEGRSPVIAVIDAENGAVLKRLPLKYPGRTP